MTTPSKPNIVIRGICERDIDLLLLEEFVASVEFRAWFLRKVGVAPDAILTKVERSVSTVSGESDLEITLRSARETVKLLIENKVDAPLQPDQAARYQERARTYCNDGTCDLVITVAITPEIYFDPEAKHGFDVLVNYEAVLNWFSSATSLGPRGDYKAAAMRQAIERGRRGWQMIPDVVATQFWLSYWQMADRLAPALRMPKPDAKPATSGFIRFCPLGLPSDVTLYHKVPYGRVDLQFAAMGNNLARVEKRFGKHLTPAMRIDQAAKSAAIRIEVEAIDMIKPFAESQHAVKAALAAAVKLLEMFESAGAKRT